MSFDEIKYHPGFGEIVSKYHFGLFGTETANQTANQKLLALAEAVVASKHASYRLRIELPDNELPAWERERIAEILHYDK